MQLNRFSEHIVISIRFNSLELTLFAIRSSCFNPRTIGLVWFKGWLMLCSLWVINIPVIIWPQISSCILRCWKAKFYWNNPWRGDWHSRRLNPHHMLIDLCNSWLEYAPWFQLAFVFGPFFFTFLRSSVSQNWLSIFCGSCIIAKRR